MYFVGVFGVFGDFAAAIGALGLQMGGMDSLDLDERRMGLGGSSGLPQHDFDYFLKMLLVGN